MPPTVWCAQHAVRFPLNTASVEQVCPAGHGLRLEGVTGYCPACDLHWDARQTEHPDACPYCRTPAAARRLCHLCERLTYLPSGSTDRSRCAGCGAVFDGDALSHACRVLGTTVVTQRRRCPACHEALECSAVAPVPAPRAVSQDRDAQTAVAQPEMTRPTEPATGDAPAAVLSHGLMVTTPVRARELHQRYLSKLIRVHFDYNLRRFFRNEKGLFYACGVGDPPGAYHIIPSWSRFGVAGDFVHWFSEIFDCDQPRGGDIWVHAPAMADAEGVLRRKGRLEVNRPPDAPPPATPSTSSAPEAPAAPWSVAPDERPQPPERPATAPPERTAQDVRKPPELASPTRVAATKRRWLPWLAAGAIAVGVGGFGVWKAYVASPSVAREAPPTAPRSPASRPNQPQTEAQTGQEAVLKALDGLAQAFSAQQSEHYRSYFDATLRPYYNRPEGTAERAVRDMAALWAMYAELVMTHKAVQVQLDPKGESATALTERTLTGRRRATGERLDDTVRVGYRFVRRGRYWLVAGVAEVKPTPDKTPRRKQK